MTSGEKELILNELAEAVLNFDEGSAKAAAQRALKAGIDPVEAVEGGLKRGIVIVGEKFARDELYLPHLLMAADALKAGVQVLEAALPKEDLDVMRVGTVVIGTVKDDIHDIGKNIVAAMLSASGFEVYDLGKDVKPEAFVEKAKEVNADIIATSSLMTTTMPGQRELMEELEYQGVREGFMVMVGGGPVTQDWADEIRCDGYAENATQAVEVARRLMARTASRRG
ncbi:MAG: B12-binding domain-containing protein [Candidatus Bathyarchaeia archaeon]